MPYVMSFHKVDGAPPTPYEGEIIGEIGYYWKLKVRVGKGYKTFKCHKGACSSTPYADSNKGKYERSASPEKKSKVSKGKTTKRDTADVQTPRPKCKVLPKQSKDSGLQRPRNVKDKSASGSVQPAKKGWGKMLTRSGS